MQSSRKASLLITGKGGDGRVMWQLTRDWTASRLRTTRRACRPITSSGSFAGVSTLVASTGSCCQDSRRSRVRIRRRDV